MTWTSHVDRVSEALTVALTAGLFAGGHVYGNAVKRELRGGYTSGAFVTGRTLAGVTVLPPEFLNGSLVCHVGTDLMYNLFWEVGHRNLFTRRFERVEVWRPVLLAEAGAIQAKVLEVASARLASMVQ